LTGVSWLLAFLGFAALVILHELGHFAAAKAVGMRVERFSLFFPPLLARVRRGETEYAIGAIPLGGYVKITGMNPAEEIPEEHQHRAYYRQPVWKRVVVIAAGPFVNIVVAFLILFALFAFKGQAVSNDKVDGVQAKSAAQGVLKPGDRIVAVDGRSARTPARTRPRPRAASPRPPRRSRSSGTAPSGPSRSARATTRTPGGC
jgi:regulator of sigma E protease